MLRSTPSPLGVLGRPAPPDRAPGLQNRCGHLEGRVGPAELGTGAFDLLGPECCAMGRGSTSLGRSAVGDGGPAGDQAGTIARFSSSNRVCHRLWILPVHARGGPAGSTEACDLIVADGK